MLVYNILMGPTYSDYIFWLNCLDRRLLMEEHFNINVFQWKFRIFIIEIICHYSLLLPINHRRRLVYRPETCGKVWLGRPTLPRTILHKCPTVSKHDNFSNKWCVADAPARFRLYEFYSYSSVSEILPISLSRARESVRVVFMATARGLAPIDGAVSCEK